MASHNCKGATVASSTFNRAVADVRMEGWVSYEQVPGTDDKAADVQLWCPYLPRGLALQACTNSKSIVKQATSSLPCSAKGMDVLQVIRQLSSAQCSTSADEQGNAPLPLGARGEDKHCQIQGGADDISSWNEYTTSQAALAELGMLSPALVEALVPERKDVQAWPQVAAALFVLGTEAYKHINCVHTDTMRALKLQLAYDSSIPKDLKEEFDQVAHAAVAAACQVCACVYASMQHFRNVMMPCYSNDDVLCSSCNVLLLLLSMA